MSYIDGRIQYQRPQAMLWSETPPTLQNGLYLPTGYEVGSSGITNDFIILSDHNRSPLDFKNNRIEKRERTVNGRMRSYHVADKLTISTSWSNLPSRSYATTPNFNTTTGLTTAEEYTVDGGAGGAELLNWYNNHTGSFYVFLAYDSTSINSNLATNNFKQYSQVVEMFVADFNYSVQKRGATNYDMWNVSVTLEEA